MYEVLLASHKVLRVVLEWIPEEIWGPEKRRQALGNSKTKWCFLRPSCEMTQMPIQYTGNCTYICYMPLSPVPFVYNPHKRFPDGEHWGSTCEIQAGWRNGGAKGHSFGTTNEKKKKGKTGNAERKQCACTDLSFFFLFFCGKDASRFGLAGTRTSSNFLETAKVSGTCTQRTRFVYPCLRRSVHHEIVPPVFLVTEGPVWFRSKSSRKDFDH